jgi:hypothetical protein
MQRAAPRKAHRNQGRNPMPRRASALITLMIAILPIFAGIPAFNA